MVLVLHHQNLQKRKQGEVESPSKVARVSLWKKERNTGWNTSVACWRAIIPCGAICLGCTQRLRTLRRMARLWWPTRRSKTLRQKEVSKDCLRWRMCMFCCMETGDSILLCAKRKISICGDCHNIKLQIRMIRTHVPPSPEEETYPDDPRRALCSRRRRMHLQGPNSPSLTEGVGPVYPLLEPAKPETTSTLHHAICGLLCNV